MCMHNRSRIARAGFTLAEMLMAVAIIAVLIALSAAAILRFRDTGPFQASVANMGKIQAALDTQWQTVRDQAMKERIDGFQPSGLDVADLADAKARPNYVSKRLVQSFPISFEEALVPDSNPNGIKGHGPYERYIRKLLNAPTTPFATLRNNAQRAAPPHVQQAVCLMMILEVGPGNVGLTADKIEGGMVQRLAPLNANGLCDGWGRPVLFTRNYARYAPPPPAPQPDVSQAPKQLVLVSIGAIRGQTQPWDRVQIAGVSLPKNTPWPSGTPWTPNSNLHTLMPRDVDARDITDEVVTTFKYQP